MPPLYDTHAHLDYPDFQADLDDVLRRAREAGITRIICVGTDLESSRKAVALGEAHEEVFVAAGWHPTHVMEAPEDVRPELRALAAHPKVVAIGETGLDYFRMPSQQEGGTAGEDARYRNRQAELFRQQLEVAAEVGLNVIIHQRGDVLLETLQALEPFTGRVRGQFHCFAGQVSDLEPILATGAVVSFTGIVTFKNAGNVRDTLAAVPEDRFMLETDSPFLAPVPYRGKRCESAHVREIAMEAARVRGCDLETISRLTCATAHRFFPKLK